MGLHGDGEHKIVALGGAKRLEHLASEHAVARPAQLVVGQAVHVLQGHEAVEAQLGIDGVAAIEGAGVVVDGRGGIAKLL